METLNLRKVMFTDFRDYAPAVMVLPLLIEIKYYSILFDFKLDIQLFHWK